MTIVINLGLHGGRISGIFITGIFGNFYTKRGGIFDFQNGNSRWPWVRGWWRLEMESKGKERSPVVKLEMGGDGGIRPY